MTDTHAPQPRFLGKRETVDAVHQVLKTAQRRVALVSPYARLGKLREMARDIRSALERSVAVTLYVRRPDPSTSRWDSLDVAEVEALLKTGLKLFAVRDLHAKVYINDSRAVVTSLNLVDTSVLNSIEAGMECPKGSANYRDIARFVADDIRQIAEPIAPQDLAKDPPVERPRTESRPSRSVAGPKRPADAPKQRRFFSSGDPYEADDDEEDDDDDTCDRRGRLGHLEAKCYARTDVDGFELDDEEEEEDDEDW